jgi:hypothetical protein
METSVDVTSVGASQHRLVMNAPYWELPPDPNSILESDKRLVRQRATALCASYYRIEFEERRVGQRCDFNCKEGQLGFEASSTWLVSCERSGL